MIKKFNTIKTKMLLLTGALMLLMFMVTMVFIYYSFLNNKKLEIKSTDLSVGYFSEEINNFINSLHTNASDLALMGELFYDTKNPEKKALNTIVKANFRNNKNSIGGGIWFEPNTIEKDVNRYCTYVYKKAGEVIVDEDFELAEYDYPKQEWYMSLKENILKGEDVDWTKPYYDLVGTKSLMTTLGAGIFDDDGKFVGIATLDCTLDYIIKNLSKLKPTENSIVVFADKQSEYVMALINGDEHKVGLTLSELTWYDNSIKNKQTISFDDEEYFFFKRVLDNDMLLIVNVPQYEILANTIKRNKYIILALILICFISSLAIYYILKKYVNKPINYLLDATTKIGKGDLDSDIKINSSQEFEKLAKSFNSMTKNIKEHIKNISEISSQKKKIETELEVAKTIQISSLPKEFPPYPDKSEFDIYANMTAAKEVGGDFYDFFFLDNDKILYLIADVSGKGVPAALFMMRVKTLIKNLGETQKDPLKLLNIANDNIAKDNEHNYFVTLFMCLTDIKTGQTTCLNAGHNQPIIKYANGECRFLNLAPNIVLGAFEDIKYQAKDINLEKGDTIILYTDGITEATNDKDELYSDDRFLEFVRNHDVSDAKKFTDTLKDDIAKFANGQAQSDDITILLFSYKNQSINQEIS